MQFGLDVGRESGCIVDCTVEVREVGILVDSDDDSENGTLILSIEPAKMCTRVNGTSEGTSYHCSPFRERVWKLPTSD